MALASNAAEFDRAASQQRIAIEPLRQSTGYA
jgi:hypothetical protein